MSISGLVLGEYKRITISGVRFRSRSRTTGSLLETLLYNLLSLNNHASMSLCWVDSEESSPMQLRFGSGLSLTLVL